LKKLVIPIICYNKSYKMLLPALYFASLCLAKETNWAVLVAGSMSYNNYRHQSDVCHAFHVLHDVGGIPEEHIIVMMADDIAYNDDNPYPGNIINTPDGGNVYPGVPKDYTGKDVNKDTFRSVLLGELPPKLLEKSKSKSRSQRKVLNSTADDNVFVYYSDHGAQGMVGMPYGDPLYADELIDTLTEMKQRGMFKNLVSYLEACESGSMFDDLLTEDMGIYAMSASSPNESSFATYWDGDRNVYLADEFSVSWIVDSEANMTASFETIKQQFETVRTRTTDSSVHAYGDFDYLNEQVGEFQGIVDESRANPNVKFIHEKGIPQWDARLEALYRMLSDETDIAAQAKIQKNIDREILHRHETEYIFREIVSNTVPKDSVYNNTFEYWKNIHLQPRNFSALRSIWSYSSHKCLTWGEYALQFWSVLVSLCESFGEPALSLGLREACD